MCLLGRISRPATVLLNQQLFRYYYSPPLPFEVPAEVKDEEPIGFPFGVPNTTPNTHPFPTWQHPNYPNPLDNPFKITCSSGSFGTITTTPGTGFITTYNPSTSTTYGYPSGSAWSYTTSKEKIF